MANVYSTQFLIERGLVGTESYLLPPGTVGILRDVDVYYNPSSFAPQTFFLLGDIGQAIVYMEWLIVSSSRTQEWRGRQVFTTGIQITSAEPADISVSGYVLTLP